jgi:hypothetical protein
MELNFPRSLMPFSKKLIPVGILVSVLFLIVVAVSAFTYINPDISCDIIGGEWWLEDYDAYLNQQGNEVDKGWEGSCVQPYSDGGKVCQDSNECEGDCVFISSKDNYGKCTPYEVLFWNGGVRRDSLPLR